MSRIKILDGGLGMLLAHLGHNEVHSSPLWGSLLIYTKPEVLEEAHLQFLAAGADIIQTATYQASVNGFCKHLQVSQEDAEELMCRAVRITLAARDKYWQQNTDLNRGRPQVAVSIGPFGASLANMSEYSGSYLDCTPASTIADFYRSQLRALSKEGAELIAFETVPAAAEAAIIQQVLAEHCQLRAWISFTCKNDHQTGHGDLIEEALASVQCCPQVVAAGINCTSVWHISALLRRVQQSSVSITKPIIVYPNTDPTWDSDERAYCKYGDDAAASALVSLLPEWLELGASWVGGCCHVLPEHTAALRRAADCLVE